MESNKLDNVYVIQRSESQDIHNISSDLEDREIKFANDCQFAVVLASYYGGKGYTTHRTEEAAITASRRNSNYSHKIIDTKGSEYCFNGVELVKVDH